LCLSSRMDEQMLATMEPTPKQVAPLASMISCALCLQRSAREARSTVERRAFEMGMPPMVAMDQAA
jgi:hypothetical protein